MSVVTCFSTGTGSGSAVELLSSSFIIPVTTSLTGITENDDNDTPDLVAVNKGSGASAVPALIAATLSVRQKIAPLFVL